MTFSILSSPLGCVRIYFMLHLYCLRLLHIAWDYIIYIHIISYYIILYQIDGMTFPLPSLLCLFTFMFIPESHETTRAWPPGVPLDALGCPWISSGCFYRPMMYGFQWNGIKNRHKLRKKSYWVCFTYNIYNIHLYKSYISYFILHEISPLLLVKSRENLFIYHLLLSQFDIYIIFRKNKLAMYGNIPFEQLDILRYHLMILDWWVVLRNYQNHQEPKYV